MHQTLEAFSDRMAFRDNAMTRLDPRLKLALALAGIAAVLCARGVLLPLAVFVACLTALLAVRMPLRVLLVRVAGPLGIAAVLFLLQTLLARPPAAAHGGELLGQWPVGPWTVTITRQGFDDGLRMGARVLGSMLVLVLLGSVTPAFKVFVALRWARMPRVMLELAMLMYRYIFGLLEQVIQVRSAQSVRLGYAGARQSLVSTGDLMGTVFLRALDQADRTHDAMRVRMYDGVLPTSDLAPLSRGQWLVLFVGLAALGACIALGLGGLL